MINNPELIKQVINNINKLSKEDLDNVIKKANEECNKYIFSEFKNNFSNQIEEHKALNNIERIVAVAIKTKEEKILVSRHSHSELIVMYPEEFKYAEQGFLTSKCRFVDRKEALKIAEFNNQIVQKHGLKDELYSEDIFLNERNN